MDYQPNEKRLKAGKSPLLNPQFRLSKADKRMLATTGNAEQRAAIRGLLVAAQLSVIAHRPGRDRKG